MNRMRLKITALVLSLVGSPSFAGESVKWTGVVQEESGHHRPSHRGDHDLELVREDDNESFSIVDSPEILNAHLEKDKKLLVEVDGELTDRFLFWGGNLIVKDFKILKELEAIEHKTTPVSAPSRRVGGRAER